VQSETCAVLGEVDVAQISRMHGVTEVNGTVKNSVKENTLIAMQPHKNLVVVAHGVQGAPGLPKVGVTFENQIAKDHAMEVGKSSNNYLLVVFSNSISVT